MTARLRTSDPHRPGRRRVRHGRGFRYLDAEDRPVPADERGRIVALAIPPAWRDVWICPWPNGHIQAVGTDAAGRRRYLYHPRFRERREAAKHDHVRRVAAGLPRLRRGIAEDLSARGLCRARVLARAARLLDLGFFRIGGERYARDHDSYGLTTLLREHAECGRGEIRLGFPAKSGRHQHRALVDETAFRAVRALLRRHEPGDRLFAYREGRAWHEVRAEDLNAYLRERSGRDVTAKDFRTWHATVLAAVALAVSALAVSARAADGSTRTRSRAVTRAVREVADYLGNTPAVCRASSIDRALERLGEGVSFGHPATQGAVERAVLRLVWD
ncbi:DNA topoisomerase IB [Streptomyces sp. NPDC056144]|uniref:DNA topoisomerase IB n=1 Tax=unclassified Streptomyces TaxID=2593676 RepID=UPI0035D700CA